MEKKLNIPPSYEEVEYENVSRENEDVQEVSVKPAIPASGKRPYKKPSSFKTISPTY